MNLFGKGRQFGSVSEVNCTCIMANKKHVGAKRLFELGPEKLAAIDRMLIRRQSCAEVARMIQEDWQLYREVNQGSLERQIRRYREETLKSQISLITPSADALIEKQRTSLAKIAIQIDPIQEMQALVLLQKARLEKAISRENTMPFILDAVNREVVTLMDMYTKLGKLMIDVGVLKKILHTQDRKDVKEVFNVLETYGQQVIISEQVKEATQKALEVLSGSGQ